LVAQTAHADTPIGTIACHHGHDRAAFNVVTSEGHGLAACHHWIEDAERVFTQEFDHFKSGGSIFSGLSNVGGQLGGPKNRGCIEAVVSVIAHMQRFGKDGAEVDSTSCFQGDFNGRA